MTQEEVLNFIKKSKKQVNCKDIFEHFKKSQSAISSNLLKLIKQGNIFYIEKRQEGILKRYYYARK